MKLDIKALLVGMMLLMNCQASQANDCNKLLVFDDIHKLYLPYNDGQNEQVPTMFPVLQQVEEALPLLLADQQGWKSLYVDYEHPYVERLWRQWGDYRIYLHRIFPIPGEQPSETALFHPHPWPSIMKILEGQYEMGLGFNRGDEVPEILKRILVSAPLIYEMVNMGDWHYVRPLGSPTLSLMITGPLWGRLGPVPSKRLGPLNQKQIDELFRDFQNHFPLEGQKI